MKKGIIVIVVFLVLIFGIGIMLNSGIEKPLDEVLLQYGDSFDSISSLSLSNDGEDKNLQESYSVVFYIDPYCESCIKSFSVAERMYEILKDEQIRINILWRQ